MQLSWGNSTCANRFTTETRRHGEKPRLTLISPEEYLAIERNADYKSEYFDGGIFAIAGAGERHNLIVINIVRELSLQMKGRPCKVYSTDMRVKVSSTGLYTYPDVVVMCGTAQLEDDQQDTLLNPTVIIEVLSKFTESYDRGEKFAHYRRLETLAEYILVTHDKCFVEHYIRQPDNQWLLSEVSSLQDTIQLPSIRCNLILTEVYDKVEIGE